MNETILHDILLIVLGGVFGACLGKLPMWVLYSVFATSIVLMIILLK